MSSADPREIIVGVLREHPEGLTLISLAESSGLHRHTARKYVNKLSEANVVFQRSVGIAKLCYLSETCTKQNVGKRLLDRLYWGRKGTASQVKLLAMVALVTFLLSGSLILASQNASLFNETDSNDNTSIETGYLTLNTELNQSTEANLTTEISSDENAVLSETNSSTEKNQNEANSSVEVVNDTIQDVNETLDAAVPSNETPSESPSNDTKILNETQETPSESMKNLQITLDYPKKIVRGGTISVKATVLNLDALRAENVVLQWTIPTGFALISGNERHFCGAIESNGSCISEISLKTDLSTVVGTNKIRAVVSYE